MVRHTETEMTAIKAKAFIILAVPWKQEAEHAMQGCVGKHGSARRQREPGEMVDKSPVMVSLEKARQGKMNWFG